MYRLRVTTIPLCQRDFSILGFSIGMEGSALHPSSVHAQGQLLCLAMRLKQTGLSAMLARSDIKSLEQMFLYPLILSNFYPDLCI